jgi:hypothetical protein
MLKRSRIDLLTVALVGLALGLASVSCSKSSSTSTPSAEPTAGPSTVTPVSVATVDLGRSVGGDKRITDQIEVFRPNDTIYASVLTTGAAPSASLKARWTFEDGQVVEETEQMIAPAGDEATEFHISKPDGWPVGKYKVEILLNGATVQTKEFEVKGA